MKLKFAVILALIILIVVGCGNNGYKDLSATQAKKLIENTPNLQLIDVREEFEYQEGHIENSILIPLGQLMERLDELNPEVPILLICRSGNRSGQAAAILVEKGYKDVNNLAKGVLGWPYGLAAMNM
jgi:rhodanese-related sulfurtransferase